MLNNIDRTNLSVKVGTESSSVSKEIAGLSGETGGIIVGFLCKVRRNDRKFKGGIMVGFRRAIFFSLVVFASIGLLFAGPASATLLFSDSFTGTDGQSLTAYDAGYVKDSGPGGTAKIDEPGLTVAGKYAAGNSLYMNQTASGNFSYTHGFTQTTVSTIYASAFFKADNIPLSYAGSYGLFVDVPVYKNPGDDQDERDIKFGIRNNDHVLTLYGVAENGGFKDLANISTGIAYQLVWKIVADPTPNKLKLYAAVNPEAGVEPTWTIINAPGDSLQTDWYVKNVKVQETINGASGWIDEIRIGTTYDDVVKSTAPVPIPGAILLFAPGLAGIAILRRRIGNRG
jgi:hypothetical protein